MEKYTEIILNLEGCRYLGEIHSRIKETFSFPDYYGENWDALWDCLRYLWLDGEIIKVNIYGFLSLPDDLREYCVGSAAYTAVNVVADLSR